MTIRIVMVEDSPFARAALREVLEQEGDLEVVGMAEDGLAALAMVKLHKPDVVTMDIQMAGGGGLAAIEQLMAHAPLPILVVTALPSGRDSDLTFEALRRGALDVASKPSGPSHASQAASLRRQIRSLAGLPVVRHVAALRPAIPRVLAPTSPTVRVPIIGIAASAGGPIAVAQVLAALPERFPGCIALVQHLPVGFVEFFASFLRRSILADVVVVASAEFEPRRGVVVVAPDDRHLALTAGGKLASITEPPEGGHRPSATVLFRSLARFAGASAIGVVLTGIGDDGTAGLLAMRQAGATTIAQDAKTSAVFGMPRAAVAAGAASRVLALEDIAQALVNAVSR